MIDFGLNHQALAVAAYVLGAHREDGWQPQESWDGERYQCSLQVRPWYNGRETGVVFQFSEGTNPYLGPVLNIAVFEHRNSDDICAWAWFSRSQVNWVSIADVPDHVAPDKWTHNKSVSYGEAGKMATWVVRQFVAQYGGIEAALARQEFREAVS